MAVEPRFCRRLASPKTIDLLMMLALGPTPMHTEKVQQQGCPQSASEGAIIEEGGDGGDDGEEGAAATSPKGKRFSGKVNVATPYVGALRYCVVAIVERLGSILDEGGEFERTSSPPEMTSVVVSATGKT